MEGIENYAESLQNYLNGVVTIKEPKKLYEPIKYIVSLGGKRLRPVLTLMTCDFFNKDFKEALPAALALELFHNFSLIHDDIMDEAPLRRGKETVHHKWDLNTGILSGDALLILAYQLFENYEPKKFVLDWVKKNKRKINIFNDAKKAVKNADVIFSDKVISLNDKVNKNKKIKDFKNFQINSKLMSFAKKDTTFLHCLPRGDEVTGDVFLGKNSEVWLQALNRVHVQKSILLYCFGKLR